MQIAERKQPFNLCKGAVKCTIAVALLLRVVSWAAMGRTLSFEANPSLSSQPRKHHKNNTQNIALLTIFFFLKSNLPFLSFLEINKWRSTHNE